MTREELEHIIRASGDITGQYEFVIVGSQSLLGAEPNPEEVFMVSMEADIYPLQAPDRIQNANTGNRVGYCLDVLDLFLAKAAAGREKDREFCMALFEHGYVTPAQVLAVVPTMPLDDRQQRSLRATIRRWTKAVRDAGCNLPEE